MLRSRSLHVLLWLVCVGPLLGAMLYLPEKVLLNGTLRPEMLQASLYVFVIPIAFVGAYALFLVPSGLTGIAAALIMRRLRGPNFVLAVTLIGGLFFGIYTRLLGRVPVAALFTSSILGASIAACCSSLAVWTGTRP